MTPVPIAIDVELSLGHGTDARAPGGAVTVALCGSWEHDGPCGWPHHNHIETQALLTRLRIVVVVPDDESEDVIARIGTALRDDRRWSVLAFESGSIRADERELSRRLASAR